MFAMRSFVATAFVVDATVLSSMDQGAAFTQCITRSDFETKTLADDITLVDRDANSCCPTGTVPGAEFYNTYQGAQIVCGFQADGSVDNTQGTSTACTYGGCYMMTQNLACQDGTSQRLNGCCGDMVRTDGSQTSTDAQHLAFALGASDAEVCLGYSYSLNNVWDETYEYCLSYNAVYTGSAGQGTAATTDDVSSNVLQVASIGTYEACGSSGGGSTGTGTGTGTSTGTGTGSSIDTGSNDSGAERVGLPVFLAGVLASLAL